MAEKTPVALSELVNLARQTNADQYNAPQTVRFYNINEIIPSVEDYDTSSSQMMSDEVG